MYNIAPVQNVSSILLHGILSKNLIESKGIKYESLADERVQYIREPKRVNNGLSLHEYANLYFNPRNAMLFTLKCNHPGTYCLIQVDYSVLDLPYVVTTDMNAASHAQFMTPFEGLNKIDFKEVFVQSWNDLDPAIKAYKKKRTCAEVLIPWGVQPRFIKGILVPDLKIKDILIETGVDEKIIDVEKYLFFEN